MKKLFLLSVFTVFFCCATLFAQADEFISIQGKWENYTEIKDQNNTGTKIRKLTFTFTGAGTLGNQEAIEKRFNMQSADGNVQFSEAIITDKGEFDETKTTVKKLFGGYDFSNDKKYDLKIVCGGIKILDQTTKKFVEYNNSNPIFREIQYYINGIKILKIQNEKTITLTWDYNMNGKTDADETMKFISVDE